MQFIVFYVVGLDFMIADGVSVVRKHGSSVISALASDARGPWFDPRSRRGKFRSSNTLSLVSFAGMTLDKCIVHRIGALTGCPLCRESHPLCRLKNPAVISIWLLVGFHPATPSVQCTPADNARKRAPGSIHREKVTIELIVRK